MDDRTRLLIGALVLLAVAWCWKTRETADGRCPCCGGSYCTCSPGCRCRRGGACPYL